MFIIIRVMIKVMCPCNINCDLNGVFRQSSLVMGAYRTSSTNIVECGEELINISVTDGTVVDIGEQVN